MLLLRVCLRLHLPPALAHHPLQWRPTTRLVQRKVWGNKAPKMTRDRQVVFEAYEERLRAANAVDFNDVILLATRLLEVSLAYRAICRVWLHRGLEGDQWTGACA